MNTRRIIGIALLAGGILSLAYGGFTYVRSTSQVDLGPISFEVQEKEHVAIPIWFGVGLAVAGGATLMMAASKP
jgi:hypothetical protein